MSLIHQRKNVKGLSLWVFPFSARKNWTDVGQTNRGWALTDGREDQNQPTFGWPAREIKILMSGYFPIGGPSWHARENGTL